MEKLLTTNDVAMAIGASDSSLRRWTNSGAIRTHRTVGGHRRIPLSEAIRFIRETGATVVRPELLGFPDADASSTQAAAATPAADAVEEALYKALLDGDAPAATGQILGLYLGGSSPAAMFDGPVGRAVQRIGELWKHGSRGILVEHRATDICIRAVSQLRQVLPPPPAIAPAAVGGAPGGDPYLLPSLMAATVFADAGYRETNFGADTPLPVLAEAAREHQASIVWLAVSSIAAGCEADLRREFAQLLRALRRQRVTLIVGGRRAADVVGRTASPDVHVLGSMSELSAYLRGAKPAAKRKARA
jgi:excisionase family DNA binding protein